MLCIFCDNSLNEKPSEEHILLNALGGKKTTRNAICADCNNQFGGTIDAELADQVSEFRNRLQLSSGKRQPPPGSRNIAIGNENFRLRPDGVPIRVGKPFTLKRNDTGWDISIRANSLDHLRTLMPDIAAQMGVSVQRLIERTGSQKVRMTMKPLETISQTLSVGGEKAIRSIAKSMLTLIAPSIGTDVLREIHFAKIRNFIKEGDPSFVIENTSLDARELPISAELIREFGHLFNFIFVRSDANGKMYAHFTLYNIAAWAIKLSDNGPRNIAISLASNPSAPQIYKYDAESIYDIPISWLASPDPTSFSERKSGYSDAAQNVYLQGRERSVERIVTEAFARHGIVGDVVVDDPARSKALFADIADRIAHLFLGLPHNQELPLEAIIAGDGPSCS